MIVLPDAVNFDTITLGRVLGMSSPKIEGIWNYNGSLLSPSQVQYYGLIKQATGEDWENTKISLSTAQPSIGGSAPTLPTRIIRFKPPAQVKFHGTQTKPRRRGNAAAFHYDRTIEYNASIEDSYIGEGIEPLRKVIRRGESPPPPALDVEVAQVIGLFHCRRHSCMYQQL